MQVIALLVLVISFIFVPAVYAQPETEETEPVLLVNGKKAQKNNFPYSKNTLIPIFKTDENVIKNQPINFELDTSFLRLSGENQSDVFIWDFGDKQNAEGKSVSHTYSNTGTYFIKIEAKFADVPFNQEITSIQINIKPDKEYEIPKAVITLDKKIVSGTEEEIKIANGQELEFSAENSISNSSQIKSYEWDFMDEERKFGQVTKHIFQNKLNSDHYAILRIKDENNLISDTYVKIHEENPDAKSQNEIKHSKSPIIPFILITGLVVLSLTVVTIIFLKIISKK